MAESSDAFSCPSCDKRYRWKPTMAGKKVACKSCGAKLRVPDEPGGVPERVEGGGGSSTPKSGGADAAGGAGNEGGYELADPEAGANQAAAKPAAAGSDGKCPSCNRTMKPGAVVCLNCGFNLKTGSKLSTQVATDAGDEGASQPKGGAGGSPAVDPSVLSRTVFDGRSKVDDAELDADLQRENQWKYLYTPLILIGVGLVWTLINIAVLGPLANESHFVTQAQGGGTAVSNAIRAGIVAVNFVARLIIQVPLTLGGLFIVASLFGTSFGTLGSAMLRLLAVVIVVGAFNDTMDLGLDILTGGFGGIGFMLKVSASLLVFFGVAMWQLETDILETMVLWGLTVFLPGFVMGFAIVVIVGILFF